MVTVFIVSLYVIFSALAMIVSAKQTNLLIDKRFSSENSSNKVKKYGEDSKSLILFGFFILISGYIGFVVSTKYIDRDQIFFVLATLRIFFCLLAFYMAAVFDSKLKIIPNYIPFSLILLRLVYFVIEFINFSDYSVNIISSLLGLIVIFVVLTIANKMSKDGIGAGDIKLLSSVAFFAGFNFVITVIVFSLVVCMLFSVAMLLTKKISMKDSLPFAPFILAGFVIVCIFKWF